MTLAEFIQENRDEIDECIQSVTTQDHIDDDERELWILNDEGMYNWANQYVDADDL
jgi:hypothetical protein